MVADDPAVFLLALLGLVAACAIVAAAAAWILARLGLLDLRDYGELDLPLPCTCPDGRPCPRVGQHPWRLDVEGRWYVDD